VSFVGRHDGTNNIWMAEQCTTATQVWAA